MFLNSISILRNTIAYHNKIFYNMEQRLTWQNLSHQLKILNEGSSLLSKIFSNGVLREIKIEDMTVLPEYQSGIADMLINYGVLTEDNGFVGIENPHLDYFRECQAGNHRMEDWIICPNCKGEGKVFDHAMGILFPIVGLPNDD